MNILITDECERWIDTLSTNEIHDVIRVVDMLEIKGVNLGFPYSSSIHQASFALRELRIQSSGHALRVFYAFDPRRDVVLLMGGRKGGQGDKRFYTTMILECTKLWLAYLNEQGLVEP